MLVTPLTRRSFKDGVLQNDGDPWLGAVIRRPRKKSAPVIDSLNEESYAAVAAMGTPQRPIRWPKSRRKCHCRRA